MERSDQVEAAMLDFYERVTASDEGSFDRLVSDHEATLAIGTAPEEWVTERERLRFGFRAEGLGISAGPDPTGWSSGDLGWFVDRPTYRFPSGGGMRTRLTSVLQRVGDEWRIVHMHVSVGVPDEEVQELQARWGTAP